MKKKNCIGFKTTTIALLCMCTYMYYVCIKVIHPKLYKKDALALVFTIELVCFKDLHFEAKIGLILILVS